MAMNQLSRASMKWSRLIGGRWLPSASPVAPKPFSTEASVPSISFSNDEFLHAPSTGVVYGRLSDVTKYTTKADIIKLLDVHNLSPEKVKVEYNRAYYPLSAMIEFPSASPYDSAVRSIGRKGRLHNIRKIIILGIPAMRRLMILIASFLVASMIHLQL